MKKIYLDSEVYLDLIEENPEISAGFNILRRVVQCEFVLVYSDHLLGALEARTGKSREVVYERYVKPLEQIRKVEYVQLTPHLKEEARFLRDAQNITFRQALYVVLSIAANATVVTRTNDLLQLNQEFEVQHADQI